MSFFRLILVFVTVLFFTPTASAQITWMSWGEAVSANKKEPKKLLIDVYTEWCGWCKKMDKNVFTDPVIEAYVKENFYAVKFNAEQKEAIKYDGHTFNFNANASSRGVHDLAVALLDSRMSYPSIVYLDENRDRISISPGFKPADKLINELSFIHGGHYKTKTYEEYLKARGK
jgi:thioredoxin-related protein